MFYLLLKEPKPIDSHSDDYNRMAAENKTLLVDHAIILRRADSLETSGRAKDSAITLLMGEKKAVQKEADRYATTVNRLAKEVKVLRQGDTSEFAQKCDSLAEQVINFKFLYEQYKEYSDSLTAKMDSQGEDYVKALEERRRLYDELKTKYTALYDAYLTLTTDYSKSLKTIKRERLKTKIAVILGLAAGAVGGAALK